MISSRSTSTLSSKSPLQTGQQRISMRSRFIGGRKDDAALKPIALGRPRAVPKTSWQGVSSGERALLGIPDNGYIAVPSWAQSPGGFAGLERWEELAPCALANGRRACANLRPGPVPSRLLRLRARLHDIGPELHEHLHPAVFRRIGLVLLGPRLVLFVSVRAGPRFGQHAELSDHDAESAAASVPVVLPPHRASRGAALLEPLERGPVHLPPQHGPLRRPHHLPDVRAREGGVRSKGGARHCAPPSDQRGTSATERLDRRGPRRLHPLLRRL